MTSSHSTFTGRVTSTLLVFYIYYTFEFLSYNAQLYSNHFRHTMMWREVSMIWQLEDFIVMEPLWVVSMPSVNTFGGNASFGSVR